VSARTPMSARMLGCVRADLWSHPRGCDFYRANVVFTASAGKCGRERTSGRKGRPDRHFYPRTSVMTSLPEGVGWQPILGQDFANASLLPPMESGHGPFGIQSLARLGVQVASIGGPPPLPGRDGLRSFISTQHSTDAVMQTVLDHEWRGSRRSKSGLSLPGAKGKRSKTSKSIGSSASANALEAGLDPVDADMPAERLSPSAYKRAKKARVERGQ
jgi:hypothetical protein